MVDISNKKYGRLKAIRPAFIVGTNWFWECYCDPELGGCRSTVFKSSTWLRRGSTKSCGCLRREIARMTGRRNRRDRSDVEEMVILRRLGFTYHVIAKMFKISGSRCNTLVLRHAPRLRMFYRSRP